MEHLVVRFANHLPHRIEREGDRSLHFLIPKHKTLETLKFMEEQPQYVIKRSESAWHVKGRPPMLQGGGSNHYRTFLGEVKKVLKLSQHELNKLPLVELQKHPQVKALYERYFKNNPDLISSRSVTNVIASNLLGYDNDTGMVRDSLADVRKKKTLPTTTIPSLEVARENEFDRILLMTFSRFLDDHRIPDVFLKSNYFTLRPHMLQAYQEDPVAFRSRMEQAQGNIEKDIVRDYKALVNEMNRSYLARYPFEEMARVAGIQQGARGFSAFKDKLIRIKQRVLRVPGAMQKFEGLEQLSQTYAQTLEAKLIHVAHVMPGLTSKMSDDATFVQAVLKNSSPVIHRVLDILEGKSMV